MLCFSIMWGMGLKEIMEVILFGAVVSGQKDYEQRVQDLDKQEEELEVLIEECKTAAEKRNIAGKAKIVAKVYGRCSDLMAYNDNKYWCTPVSCHYGKEGALEIFYEEKHRDEFGRGQYKFESSQLEIRYRGELVFERGKEITCFRSGPWEDILDIKHYEGLLKKEEIEGAQQAEKIAEEQEKLTLARKSWE